MSLSILVISFSPCMPIALDSPRFQPERIREAQLHFLYMRFSNVTLHITIKLGAVSESRGPNGGACPPPLGPPPVPPFQGKQGVAIRGCVRIRGWVRMMECFVIHHSLSSFTFQTFVCCLLCKAFGNFRQLSFHPHARALYGRPPFPLFQIFECILDKYPLVFQMLLFFDYR